MNQIRIVIELLKIINVSIRLLSVFLVIKIIFIIIANESKYEEKKRILSAKLINDQENNAGRSGNLSGLPLSNSTNRESW